MARTRTAEENKQWWLDRAAEYEKEAKRHVTAGRNAHWLKKADEARTKAQTYTQP